MDRQEDDSLDRSTYRQIYDARLDLSTELSRIMGSPVESIERIRHSIKPRVVYEYIPDQDQSDLPDFDTGIDRIDEANEITYSLTNTFTARTTKAARSAAMAGNDSILKKRIRTDGSDAGGFAAANIFRLLSLLPLLSGAKL